jgi:NitT/TauT family transport system permease protein
MSTSDLASATSRPTFDAGAVGPRPSWSKRLSPGVQLARAGVLALIIVAWNVATEAELVEPIYSTTPRRTFSRLLELLGDHLFWSDLVVTLREALVGWTIGAVCGLVAGLVLGRWVAGMRVMGPFLTFFNAVPKIALAPIIILWFGVGESSKIFTAVLAVFFIVQVPTTAAVSLVNPDLDTVVTTMGGGELHRFRLVYLPGILASVFGALRLGAVYALLTVVFSEFLAAKRGLGQRLITSTNNFRMDDAFALMIVLAFLALLINGGIGLVERRLLRWRAASGQGSVVSL